tara:strand:- start:4503 stop:5501 length:999 start_codon:yes stop_codon:yes gene_type:complete
MSEKINNPNHNNNTFICMACEYITTRKSNYQKHINTKKHILNVQKSQKKVKVQNKIDKKFICENCNSKYKFKSGLSRHKKKCIPYNESLKKQLNNIHAIKDDEYTGNISVDINDVKYAQNNDELIKLLVAQNKKQAEQTSNALDLVQQSLSEMSKMVPKIGNNNNNTNKISINVYLNENCKNAMNLTNFVKNIQVSLDDLMYTKDNGYVKGITNIFTKQLNDLKPTERPIHCSDKKRLQFYIKDNDVWEKNVSQSKLDKSIRDLEREQIKKLTEWEKLNPDYLKDEKKLSEWQKIIHQIIDHANDIDRSRNIKSIKKNLAEYVELKDEIKSK